MMPSIKLIVPDKITPSNPCYWYGVYFTALRGAPLMVEGRMLLGCRPTSSTPPPEVITAFMKIFRERLREKGIPDFEQLPEQAPRTLVPKSKMRGARSDFTVYRGPLGFWRNGFDNGGKPV